MTEKQFEEFIYEMGKSGSIYGLEPIRNLLNRMDNPEKSLKFVHIAGTNGKGSILAYTSTILKEAGYKVGRYVSPCIDVYQEKIQINGRMITKKDLYSNMEYIKGIVEQMQADGEAIPTLFEIETALAFKYFKDKGCDIVVLETGLGGTYDATNVIPSPLVCAFATISMDHMGILGNTLEKIAENKAGIIKEGAIVVTSKQRAGNILQMTAALKKCHYVEAKEPVIHRVNLRGQIFTYGEYKKLETRLLGTWQPTNAAVAIEIVKTLNSRGFAVDETAIRRGIAETVWNGRFTVICKKPLIIIDGAHNEDASLKLRDSIKLYLAGKKLIYIVGILKDKEYDKILANTAELAEHIIAIAPPENVRALSNIELAKSALQYNKNVTTADSVEEAVELASLLADNDCAIIAFGSLSYLGRMMKVVANRRNI